MHEQAMDWVTAHRVEADRIVEIGGRNANYGTARPLWPGASSYVGVDLFAGEGVDWVGDFLDYRPDEPVDLVICMEVAEHCKMWREMLVVAASITRPSGALLFTAAGPGRAPHTALDGSRPIPDDEFYENIEVDDLREALADAGYREILVEWGPGHPLALEPGRELWPGDVYALATTPDYWEPFNLS